jgi:Ubiquitin-like modifier-activating enzyme ATG7 N-terminus
MQDGSALRQPELLTPALLVLHCDLKNHTFRHRFAFPHLALSARPRLLSAAALSDDASGFGERSVDTVNARGCAQPCLVSRAGNGAGDVELHSLEHLSSLAGKWPEHLALAAIDPSPHPQGVLGWLFRNYLALLSHLFPGQTVSLIALRAAQGRLDAAASWRVSVQLPDIQQDGGGAGLQLMRVAGWEAAAGEVRVAPLAVGCQAMGPRWRLLTVQQGFQRHSAVSIAITGFDMTTG